MLSVRLGLGFGSDITKELALLTRWNVVQEQQNNEQPKQGQDQQKHTGLEKEGSAVSTLFAISLKVFWGAS